MILIRWWMVTVTPRCSATYPSVASVFCGFSIGGLDAGDPARSRLIIGDTCARCVPCGVSRPADRSCEVVRPKVKKRSMSGHRRCRAAVCSGSQRQQGVVYLAPQRSAVSSSACVRCSKICVELDFSVEVCELEEQTGN